MPRLLKKTVFYDQFNGGRNTKAGFPLLKEGGHAKRGIHVLERESFQPPVDLSTTVMRYQ
jgi:hypothetical protein